MQTCNTIREYVDFIASEIDGAEIQAGYENAMKSLDNQLVSKQRLPGGCCLRAAVYTAKLRVTAYTTKLGMFQAATGCRTLANCHLLLSYGQ